MIQDDRPRQHGRSVIWFASSSSAACCAVCCAARCAAGRDRVGGVTSTRARPSPERCSWPCPARSRTATTSRRRRSQNGATAVIAERAIARLGVPQMLVGSSRSSLATGRGVDQRLSRAGQLGVVGITGTDGKTTTSYLVRAMLGECGLPAGLITHDRGDRRRGELAARPGKTTPEAPDDSVGTAGAWSKPATDSPWSESTSHGLALERVAQVAYDIAVLTNITHEHLDLHGTFEEYVAAKRSLFERLSVSVRQPRQGLAQDGRNQRPGRARRRDRARRREGQALG